MMKSNANDGLGASITGGHSLVSHDNEGDQGGCRRSFLLQT